MAITLNTNLESVYYAGNDIDLRFLSDAKFTTSPVKAFLSFSFSSLPSANGDTLEISADINGSSFTRVITFNNSPTYADYEISYTGNIQSTLNAIADMLTSDPVLSEHFTFYHNEGDFSIRINALEAATHNLGVSATGNAAITVNSVTSGAEGVSQPNYRMRLWLIIGNTSESDYNNSYRTKELEFDPDDSNRVHVRIQKYVDTVLDGPGNRPQSSNSFFLDNTNCRPVTIVAGEKLGDPLDLKLAEVLGTFRALRGGLNPIDFAHLGVDIIADNLHSSFLTNRTKRRIAYKQPDYLSFYTRQAYTGAKVKSEVKIFNGVTITIEVFSGDLSPNRFYSFSAMADFMAPVGQLPPGVPYSYRVFLTDSSDNAIISDGVTFFIEEDENDLVFEFQNSQGSLETFRFSGEHSFYHEITKEVFQVNRPFNATFEDPQWKSAMEQNKLLLDVSTGALYDYEIKYLAEFLSSRYVWMIVGNDKIPVDILTNKTQAEAQTYSGSNAYPSEFSVRILQSPNHSRQLI